MKRRLPAVLPLAVLAAALVGMGVGVGLHFALRQGPARAAPRLPALHGEAVWPARHRPAPAFRLRDETGRPVSLAAERGRTVLLAFMDPLCKQECPIEGRELALAERSVKSTQRAVLLVVSVNPEARGTDAVAAARKWGFAGDWHWLLGSRAQLARVWRAYDVTVLPKANDVVHSTAVYVIDRNGFERAGFNAPLEPPFLADDLRALA